ncbi:lysM domain-containing GPI-anchored protein 2-like [Corylus avellana]|uniref:lysM domain-containing GPI-anchored protein 2-like n=1 Tax=Corylus avellana TaxID=13451 RepID=UPI00286BA0A3|nr:lysM domain-containing GPI-anchored protein 2-like [Corylus avellana]
MGYAKVLLGVLLVSALATTLTAQPLAPFKCSKATAKCTALIDYVSPSNTILSSIKDLFQVKKLRNLLGANNFPSTTSEKQTIRAYQKIRIPFTCACSNGTGLSNRSPVYTVGGRDGLYHIAAEVFSGLVTFQEIAAVNGLVDVNKIEVGQKLWIPLPCSCDDVDGVKVVHYGHLVDGGSTVEGIAEQYGTTSSTLLSLNQMTNASDLKAAQVLDVPLKGHRTEGSANRFRFLAPFFAIPRDPYAPNSVKLTHFRFPTLFTRYNLL